MSRDIRRIREVLGPHDPVPGAALRDAGRGERAQARLAAILAEPVPAGSAGPNDPAGQAPPWPRPPRRAPARPLRLALGAAALVAVGALVLGVPARPGGPAPVYAATPAPLSYAGEAAPDPAAPLLLELAEVARKQPAEGTAGRYRYRRVEGWFLQVDQSGDPPPVTVDPVVVEDWRAADGSGRVVEWPAPATPGAAEGPAADPATAPAPISDERLPAGGLDAEDAPRDLPADPARLEAALLDAADRDIPTAAATYVGVRDLLDRQAAGPELRAAALRVLAGVDGVLDRGAVTDRAGRPGVAISLESGYTGVETSHRLILDPATGRLLAAETIVTGETRALRIKPPAVIGYRLYTHSGSVDSVDARP